MKKIYLVGSIIAVNLIFISLFILCVNYDLLYFDEGLLWMIKVPFVVSIMIELLCSIYYFSFIFIPLGITFFMSKKISIIVSFVLFLIRIIILIIMDNINPAYYIIDIITLCISVFIITIFFRSNYVNHVDKERVYKNNKYYDIDANIIKKYEIGDINLLKQNLYNNFVNIQKSLMNFDYSALNNLLTDELYKSYETELKDLKNIKIFIDDFELIDSKICDVKKSKDVIIVKYYLNIKANKYVLNSSKSFKKKNGSKINIQYMIIFQKIVNDTITKCPNCGGNIKMYENKCSHCNSILPNYSDKWIMSKKYCVNKNKVHFL